MVVLLAGCGSKSKDKKDADITLGGKSFNEVVTKVSNYAIKHNSADTVAASKQDWLVLSFKKLGIKDSENFASEEYNNQYYDGLRKLLKQKKGILDKFNQTEYARTSMALLAIGKNPTDVEGYNLVIKMDNYNAVKAQGLNAEYYALHLNNWGKYKFKNEKKYLNDILKAQHKDGGFSYGAGKSDIDMTAMAVQALAPYRDENKRAKPVIEKALKFLSKKQNGDGGYDTCESVAQVIIMFSCLKENPLTAEGFQKKEKNLGDGLMVYYKGDGFCHSKDNEINELATEQALRALASIKLGMKGKSIYE